MLNSELPHNSRQHILQEFNKGIFDYLIAADEQLARTHFVILLASRHCSDQSLILLPASSISRRKSWSARYIALLENSSWTIFSVI